MKKIVYGISNYKMVKEDNYLYIDKTPFIKTLENLNEKYLIFLRPRRFGKSLFLSTLHYYYDENTKKEFEKLFSDTHIGKNPTPLKNSYRILFFEFSGIEVDGNIATIYHDFNKNVQKSAVAYLMNYGYEHKYIEYINTLTNPKDVVKELFTIAKNDSIYILIDEYDQFANAILAHSMDDFLKMVGKGGFVRSFYEVLKTATLSGVVQRMFITGVTPITLDSLSSGFNIVKHLSYKKEFNALAGFTQKEVEYSLENSIFQQCSNIKKERLLKKLKSWYNGYLFNIKAKERIYNATLVNYFITEFDFDDCSLPTNMLDSNVASDYKAIMRLFTIGDSEQNYKILNQLIETGSITGTIKDRYDLNREFSRDDFITLIYSMGFITIQDEEFGEIFKFEIPNYVIKILYFNYFAIELKNRNNLTVLKDIQTILVDLARGNGEPFHQQLSEVIRILSNRDHMGFNEAHFQVITLSLLSFASFYFIESQPEKNRRYPDILLIGRDKKVPTNYLFELKWVKGREDYNSKKKEGITQVEEYLEMDTIQAIPKLKAYLLIGSKDGVEFLEV